MSKKESDALKSRLAEFESRNWDNPAVRTLRKELSDLVAQSMPRNMKRLAPVLNRTRQLASIDPTAVGDPTYRQIEELHFGKPGRVPKDHFETAARDFVARTEGADPQSKKTARRAIVAELMADYSITEEYAKRRLGEEIKTLISARAKTAK